MPLQETYNGTAEIEYTFLGKAVIKFRTNGSAVTNVVLHINDLKIDNYEFLSNSPQAEFNESHYNSVTDKWTIPVTISANVVVDLVVNYRGFMRDDMAGFYRSYYIENGNKIWMATTQFQPSDARRAFPCFDVSQSFFTTHQHY